MDDLTAQFRKQWDAVSQVPGDMMTKWPTFISFGVVETLSSILLQALPVIGAGSILGTAYEATVHGMADSIKFITWDRIGGL